MEVAFRHGCLSVTDRIFFELTCKDLKDPDKARVIKKLLRLMTNRECVDDVTRFLGKRREALRLPGEIREINEVND